jgi:hypothetical protein
MYRVRVIKPFDGHAEGDIVPVHGEQLQVLEQQNFAQRVAAANIQATLPTHDFVPRQGPIVLPKAGVTAAFAR